MEEEKVVDENSINDEKQTLESKFLKMIQSIFLKK